MSEGGAIERELASLVRELRERDVRYALVGGLAVSIRGEVRFTRDVDVAVAVADDREAEALVLDLSSAGYRVAASVEHDVVGRLSTVRLVSGGGVKVDLLFASSGIEAEVVDRATETDFLDAGPLPVARAEELVAMKVLSMTERRLQDRIDVQKLLELGAPNLDEVRANLELIRRRGYDRGQDLAAKLEELMGTS